MNIYLYWCWNYFFDLPFNV